MRTESRTAAVGLIVFVVMAILEIGPIHADEYFQLIEFAQYRLGNTSASDLPWEFHERMRPTLQVWIVVGVIRFLNFLRVDDPFTIALVLRLMSCVGFWFAILKFGKLLAERHFPNPGFSKVFHAGSCLIWFVPVAAAHFSSESSSAIFLLFGLYPLIKDPLDSRGILLTGLFLGLSFLFRYQIGISVVGVYLWLVIVAKVPIRKVVGSGLVFIAVIAMGAVLDSVFYREVVVAPFNYLEQNIFEDKASSFGTEPWHYYITKFALSRPVIGVLLLVFFVRGVVSLRSHLFTWVIVPFVVVHSLIAHKEMRFLFPMIYPFVFIAFHGLHSCLGNREFCGFRAGLVRIFLVANACVILGVMIMPHVSESNFRYLYRNLEDGDGNVISFRKEYFDLHGLKVTFYRPDGVTSMVVDDEAGLPVLLADGAIERAFLISDGYEPPEGLENYTVSRVHSVIPDWLVRRKGEEWRRALESETIFLIRRRGAPVDP